MKRSRKKSVQFSLGTVGIVLILLWLAKTGFEEGKAYYKTLEELEKMGPKVHEVRLRVAGDVQKGSIQKGESATLFVLIQGARSLPIKYMGLSPLPDTFVDGAQAIVEGRFSQEKVFQADRIQAKCASKYEAKPGTSDIYPSKS
jgi:cytochrome c-type biogenesis protein CcmE